MNSHITDFLRYYIKSKNPQYAVLIKGAWGAGKTYYAKNSIKELAEEIHDEEKSSTESSKKSLITYILVYMELVPYHKFTTLSLWTF